MARVMSKRSVLTLVRTYWESWRRSMSDAHALDAWMRGEQYDITDSPEHWAYGRPYSPRATTEEYDDLGRRTPTPWAGLVVKSLAQTAYVDGVRMPGSVENMQVWKSWQRNGWDAKQTAVHRAAIGHGASFGIALPGVDQLSGDKMAKMMARSAKRMAAFYDSDDDEWPRLAIDATPYKDNEGNRGWNVDVYDDTAVHHVTCKLDGGAESDWEYLTYDEHPLRVTPVARCANMLDLDGKATGEIEPIIPLLRRVDQDTFDRLIVQRFGAWKIRYIAGMARPSTEAMANMQAMKLKVEDLLISTNHETKFGTLDATPIDGFISASDADLRVLAAITQTPPHHLLGLSSNLQAEALAAAESGLQRKSADFKMNAGEFHEQMFRLVATIEGHADEARAFDMQVRWRDTESRSLTQAADALGKLAVQLKIPLEMLWEKVPGWTDGDTDRAKKLVETGALDALLNELAGGDPNAGNAQQTGDTGGNGGA